MRSQCSLKPVEADTWLWHMFECIDNESDNKQWKHALEMLQM